MQSLRSLPQPFWVLVGGTFLNKFGTFVLPFLALYLTGQGYTEIDVALATGAYGFGHLVATGVGGYLADRMGRRNTIMLSMFSTAVTMLALSQAHSLRSIAGLAFLTGLTAELYRPASGALLTDLVPSEHRVIAFATYRLAINAGWAFGPATAALLAAESYLWLFIGDALTSALFGWIAWRGLPHGALAPGRGEKSESLASLWRDRAFLRFMAASFLVGLVFVQIGASFGLHIAARGFSAMTYGLLLSLNGLIVVLCELPLTAFVQRLPIRPLMATGYFLIGAGFALSAVAYTVPVFVVVVLIFTSGEMLSMPLAWAYVANLAPSQLRGRYMGAYGLTLAGALVAGPSLGLVLFRLNPTWLWISCAILGIAAAAIILGDKG